MEGPAPQYYASLAPFRSWFGTGVPILTWHKLGPRPARVRLRGLYLSARQFAGQLAELREAGFVAGGLDEVCGQARPGRRVVLTFDDGYVNVLEHGLEPLARGHWHAMQFLVAGRLGMTNDWDAAAGEVSERLMDAVQVREWLAAGHAIGSHTVSHPRLTELPREAAREEIEASKKRLEDEFGRAVEHFCYPYGDWNVAVRDLVAGAGYRTACTTDFGINPATTGRFELKRLTARYRSRSLKALWAWWGGVGRRSRPD